MVYSERELFTTTSYNRPTSK